MEGRLFNMGKEGACKIKKAPLMIKPSKPPPGGEGKTHNRPSPVGNAPLLPTAPPPEGEVLAALCLVMLMREMLLCDLLCPRLRGKGGAVRHQRGGELPKAAPSCRTRHSERSEESRGKPQVRE